MFRTKFLLGSLCIGACLFSACGENRDPKFLPYYNTPDFTPLFFNTHEDALTKVNHTIGDFSLLDQDSLPFSRSATTGKIHVANFIFTTCGSICPMMTGQMQRVGEAFNTDKAVMLLSYSVTPWIDKPSVLKAYKINKGISKKNWYFLTGSKSTIYSLARKSYFAEESLGFTKESTEFLHTEHFILVDKTGRIRGIYNGTLQLEADQLIRDIHKLKDEDQYR